MGGRRHAPRVELTQRLFARPIVWGALLLALAAAAIAFYGGAFATKTYFDQATSRGQTTLRLAVAVLRGQMSRYQSLPALIADHYDIQALLAEPDKPALRAKADAYLKEINGLLASSDVYVIKPGGETIAASNFDGPVSFVGENFSYRPYYQDAIQGRQGRFFALGTTSLKRGYYFSSPVIIRGAIKGVVVFKVDIDAIEELPGAQQLFGRVDEHLALRRIVHLEERVGQRPAADRRQDLQVRVALLRGHHLAEHALELRVRGLARQYLGHLAIGVMDRDAVVR